MNNAYLLGRDGTIIPVLNHPSADFEFDSVLRVLTEYMDDAKELAGQYINNPSEPTKQSILKVYNNYWCKVRSWDNDKLITFRIASSDKFSWHATIVRFLIEHPCYKNFKVTVESDKSTGINKTFWDEIPYGEALLSTYDNIDSWDKAFNKMQNRLDIINVHHSLTNFSTYNEYPVLQKITISIDSDITKYVESGDSFDGGILKDTQVVADWMSFMGTVEGVIELEENFSLGTTETGKGLPIDPNVPNSHCYYVDVGNTDNEVVCHLEVDFQFSTHTSIDKFNIRKNTIQVVQETTYPVDTDSGQPSQIIIKRDYSDYDLAMLAVIEMLNEIGK